MTQNLTSDQFQNKVIEASNEEKIVVDFWAPWCAPCQMLAPTLEQVCQESGVKLYKVNVDQAPELAQTYGVRGIPAVKLFHKEQIINQFTGVQPATKIKQFLQ